MGYDLRTCPHCGRDFERTVRAGQKYCTKNCRKLANKQKDTAIIARWQNENPESRMVSWARQRARRKGLEHNITKEDVVIPERCPVFGFPLERKIGNGHGGQYNSPSLDRKDSSLGYIKGNIQVISQLANAMKSDATPEQLIQFSKWIQEEYGYE